MPEDLIVASPDLAAMVRAAEKRAAHPGITLAANTIHNPAELRHFMTLQAVPGRVTVRRNGEIIAATDDALVCLEVGKEMYLPVYYLPLRSVYGTLQRFDRHTHCPLKGDASYHSLDDATTPIAWSYDAPFDYARQLAGHVAFDTRQVSIEITPH